MDKSTIVGIILAIIAVGVGMVLKGVEVVALLNPAAILIIFIGTAASISIAFPTRILKNIPQYLKIIFADKKMVSAEELIVQFTDMADMTRKEGLLSLEGKIKDIDQPFMVSGLQLVVDGQPVEFIREVLFEKIDAMEKRHADGANVFAQAGTYAPTLGVLGAVIGLIAALQDLDDTTTLGKAISAAFVATLLGIFSGYVLWHPFASKLKEKSKREVHLMELMVEGILSITNGDSPRVIEDKLCSYLSGKEIVKMKDGQNAAE